VTPATPTPRTLYVHDDLTALLAECPETSAARRLGSMLLARLRGEPSRLVVLTVERQIDALVAQMGGAGRPPTPPRSGPRVNPGPARMAFELTLGIGQAGVRVAAQVHERTGWFPVVRRVDLWREETEDGRYLLGGADALAAELRELPGVAALAVVDDTIFSGFTVRAVLAALPATLRGRTHVFCLRGVADSIAEVAKLAPVTAGVAAPGAILTDVSFINASGLVRRGSIRRAGRPPLAFFERPDWMTAWFPDDHAEVTALCRDLCTALESEATKSGTETPTSTPD
jgi:hypothetical protein